MFMFSCLGHSEYPAQPRYLQGHFAGLAAYKSEDVLDGVVTADHVRVESLHLAVHKSLQQVDHLLRAVEGIVASIQHYHAQLDVGQEVRVCVDLVQSEEESL